MKRMNLHDRTASRRDRGDFWIRSTPSFPFPFPSPRHQLPLPINCILVATLHSLSQIVPHQPCQHSSTGSTQARPQTRPAAHPRPPANPLHHINLSNPLPNDQRTTESRKETRTDSRSTLLLGEDHRRMVDRARGRRVFPPGEGRTVIKMIRMVARGSNSRRRLSSLLRVIRGKRQSTDPGVMEVECKHISQEQVRLYRLEH